MRDRRTKGESLRHDKPAIGLSSRRNEMLLLSRHPLTQQKLQKFGTVHMVIGQIDSATHESAGKHHHHGHLRFFSFFTMAFPQRVKNGDTWTGWFLVLSLRRAGCGLSVRGGFRVCIFWFINDEVEKLTLTCPTHYFLRGARQYLKTSWRHTGRVLLFYP